MAARERTAGLMPKLTDSWSLEERESNFWTIGREMDRYYSTQRKNRTKAETIINCVNAQLIQPMEFLSMDVDSVPYIDVDPLTDWMNAHVEPYERLTDPCN